MATSYFLIHKVKYNCYNVAGKVKDGSNAFVANGSYHRYKVYKYIISTKYYTNYKIYIN